MELLIRRAAVSDAAALAAHLGEPEVYGGTLLLPYPSEPLWAKRLSDGLSATPGDILLIAEREGALVGHGSLAAAGPQARRRHVAVLGIAVSARAQGQGVGTALMKELCDYADRWSHVLRIELNVFVDNAVAIRLYQNFGFQIEGTLRAHALRDGCYVDSHIMARLHPNPPRWTP
ncbi:MAG: GNAT family N-acetyltransferase [Pseudomonadota bacterium]|nr:GNAT family N-acetyltransferase [Pseudomonadota bacterium]